MLFGSISPNRNRTSVVATVPQTTAPEPQFLATITVTMAAALKWTMFVPIRIVVIARSKSSSTRMARLARTSPFSSLARMRARETEANAVSASAK